MTVIKKIRRDPDIANVLPEHTPGERSLVEQKILQKACPVRLAVWREILGSPEFSGDEFLDTAPASALMEAVKRSGVSAPEGDDDVARLNNLLKTRELRNNFPDLKLPAQADDLIKRAAELTEKERMGLNRLVLEEAYPEQCPRAYILADGYLSHEICERKNIPFETVEILFSSLVEVKIWRIETHLATREINAFQRYKLCASLKAYYAEQGRQNKIKGAQKTKDLPTLVKPLNTNKEIARVIKSSTGQCTKMEFILKNGTAADDDALSSGKKSVNKVHKEIDKKIKKGAEAKRIAAARLAYGALSEDEKIKLILGDCLKELPGIPENSVDFIIVDPPFNVGLPYRTHDDSMTAEEYYSWCLAWMKQLYRVLKIHHFVLIASGYSNEKLVQKAIEESGLTYLHPISWYKPNCQCTLAGSGLFYRVEKMFLCSKGVSDMRLIDRTKFYEDIIILNNSTPKQPDAVDHPAARPVGLYQYFFEGLTKPNDLILDPMFGSGSSAAAAKILGRRYVGIEIDKYYHAKGLERVNKLKDGVLLDAHLLNESVEELSVVGAAV